MSQLSQNGKARIMLESLKEKDDLPYVGWNSKNTWFVLGVSTFIGLFTMLRFGPAIGVLLGVIALYVTYDLVRSTPPYCNVIDWIRTNITYMKEPSKFTSAADAHVKTTSTLRAAIETGDSTRDLTQVERLYPPHGIVEQKNGDYSMVLRYEPPNLDFSTNDGFITLMESFTTGYNEAVDFDVHLHLTTRPVDLKAYFEKLAERMEDPDVQQNEIFKAVLQEMKGHREGMLDETDTETTHFYFIVTVSPSEVKGELGGDDSATERSRVFQLLNHGGGSDEEDVNMELKRKKKMQKELFNKADALQKVVSGPNDYDTAVKVAPSTEAAAILESFWTGNSVPLEAEGRHDRLPQTATVMGPKNRDTSNVSRVAEVATE